jgi:hypothetical protein
LTNSQRKARLEALLLGFQRLWRPQPFKIETPDWCGEYPALTEALLALEDESVERLGADNEALIGLVANYVPELSELITLLPSPLGGGGGGEGATFATPAHLTTKAPLLPHPNPAPRPTDWDASQSGQGGAKHASRNPAMAPEGEGEKHLFTDIPGRKQAQIEAYADALGQPRAPLLEWCAGKGHLGRLLAHRWHWPVASLEIDATLCEAGEDLARHAHVDCMQHFIRADALARESARHIHGRHAVALHACGDLHTRLIADAAAQASPAIDLAPCCYYRTVNERYRPFNPSELELNHDDLRLAVTETVTASAKQRRQSRRALAWKLGWVELRKALTGNADYRTFPPVPEAWLRGDFAGFVERMNERTGLHLSGNHSTPSTPPPPAGEGCAAAQVGGSPAQLAHYEALGHTRAARMLRLQLLRLAFRRPLEIWLLMDMAVFLEKQGYAVDVRTFCPAALTPRNLLLSARRYT